jgi:hypothetical protein
MPWQTWQLGLASFSYNLRPAAMFAVSLVRGLDAP